MNCLFNLLIKVLYQRGTSNGRQTSAFSNGRKSPATLGYWRSSSATTQGLLSSCSRCLTEPEVLQQHCAETEDQDGDKHPHRVVPAPCFAFLLTIAWRLSLIFFHFHAWHLQYRWCWWRQFHGDWSYSRTWRSFGSSQSPMGLTTPMLQAVRVQTRLAPHSPPHWHWCDIGANVSYGI